MKRITREIFDFVHAKDYAPVAREELAEAMGVGKAEQGAFRAACKALMRSGRILLGDDDTILPQQSSGRITGTFRANARGFGFVIPTDPVGHADLYVPSGASRGAMTGDTVIASVKRKGKRDGKMLYEGAVLEVVRRGQSRFVGALHQEVRRWFVISDGQTMHAPIMVDDPGAKSAKPGDQVVVELTQFPSEKMPARGVIVKVIGPSGAPGVDTLSIIEQYEFPTEFREAVLQEAGDVSRSFDIDVERERRLDLRGETIITIDPADARDFDDAISITVGKEGTCELGVHIADVSHFVQEEGAIDVEAKARTTSVYFPGTVIPMLPEVLSNGVCSLQEQQQRLTKSAFITYDADANVIGTRFANTVIASTKRLTYEEASAALQGKTGAIGTDVVALLKRAESLARAILARRMREGMLRLDMPEMELVLDGDRNVIDVKKADTSFSHTIIEMFMVEANEAVAKGLTANRADFLRRIHEGPSEIADAQLRRFLKALGHGLPANADRHAMQSLLEETRGKQDGFVVHMAVLRSMSQAEYSPRVEGHFALASEDYCHFTSPIRRYPDLTVHRLFEQHLVGDKVRGVRRNGSEAAGADDSFNELVVLGKHCSTSERRAEDAERELKQVLTLRLLEPRLGEVLPGTITGLASIGLFVQLDDYLIDGLLAFDTLPGDWWDIDESRSSVVGRKTGKRMRIGDRVDVQLLRIHIPTRRLDLGLSGKGAPSTNARTTNARKRPSSPRARKPATRPRRRR